MDFLWGHPFLTEVLNDGSDFHFLHLVLMTHPLLIKVCFMLFNLRKTACNSVSSLRYGIGIDVSCVNVSVVARRILGGELFDHTSYANF
jgi:hypothetical protein